MLSRLATLGLLALCLLPPASADARGPRRKHPRAATVACSRAEIDARSHEDALWLLVSTERRGRLMSCSRRQFRRADDTETRTTAVFSGGETIEIVQTSARTLSLLRLRDAVPEPEAARLLRLVDRASARVAESGRPDDLSAFWRSVQRDVSGRGALTEATDSSSSDRVRGVVRATSMSSFRLPSSGRVDQLQTVGVDGEIGALRWVTGE